jgi:hypothetical protein
VRVTKNTAVGRSTGELLLTSVGAIDEISTCGY